MKTIGFFGVAFLVLTALCGFFWIFDGPGSGMAIPTILFAVLGIGGVLADRARSKSLNDKSGK